MGVFKPGADFEADTESGYHTFAVRPRARQQPAACLSGVAAGFRPDAVRACARVAAPTPAKGTRWWRSSSRPAADAPRGAHRRRPRATASRRATWSMPAAATRFCPRRRNCAARTTSTRARRSSAIFAAPSCGPGEDAGNISIYSFEHGWMWMIPLPDGVMSVGRGVPARIPQAAQGQHGRIPAGHAAAESRRCGSACSTRSSSATRCASPATIPTTRRAWAGPAGCMVGDAFAFLDPVFSSGVYLAMSGAEQAADVVDAALARAGARSGAAAQAREAPARRAWRASRSSSTASTGR